MFRKRKLDRPLDEQDPVLGAPTAPVTLVAYVDYLCASSAELFSNLEAIRLHFGSQIRIGVRPLPAHGDPRARLAAEAAEAAAAQGRFWEMSALLFEHQDALDRRALLGYAYELRLDLSRFARELDGGVHRERLEELRESAERGAIRDTPAVFIQGEPYDGGRDLRSLINALEEAGRKAPHTYADLEEHPFIDGA